MRKIAFILIVAMALCSFAGCAASSDAVTLNVLNWGDYIDEELINQFTEETGIRINYTTMANNEEMLVKLQQEDCIYDLCFPSDYIIERLIGMDLLHELDMNNIPNAKNIDPQFMDLSFDPENKYSVPYMWGTIGILYNTTMVSDPVNSWDILWNEKYSGQIVMYNSIRDSIGVALMKLGYDINTRDEAEVRDAEQTLIDQKPLVLAYLGDDIKDRMINGGAALAVVYSGDAVACMDPENGNTDLAYAVPDSGSNIWFDNVVIPKSSTHAAEAEAFINFLCDPAVAAQNAEYIGYSTPNSAALELMDPYYTENDAYNPPAEMIANCEVFHDLGDFINVYNESWNRIISY